MLGVCLYQSNNTKQTGREEQRFIIKFYYYETEIHGICAYVHFVCAFGLRDKNYVERIPLGFQKPNDIELTLMYDVSIKLSSVYFTIHFTTTKNRRIQQTKRSYKHFI